MPLTRMMFSWRNAASATASLPVADPLGGPRERGAVRDLFQEQADDLGVLVLDHVVDGVGDVDHRLVAHGGDQAEADALRLGNGLSDERESPALQRDAYRAGDERRRDR